ncbi:hypothetical protein ACI2KE_19395 [Pseudomonas monteilii]
MKTSVRVIGAYGNFGRMSLSRWRAYSLQLRVRACVGEVTVAEYLQAIDDPQHLELSIRFSERQIR